MPIIENINLVVTEQVKFPRSKKKRIKKKWGKNPKNFITKPDLSCYMFGNNVICHPVVAKELKGVRGKETFTDPLAIINNFSKPKFEPTQEDNPLFKTATMWGVNPIIKKQPYFINPIA